MVSINKTRGVNMAGFEPGKLRRLNNLAKVYPKAPIGTLATLAGISSADIGNYTTDDVGTRATNANFGNFTQTQNTEVQSPNSQVDNTNVVGFQGGGTDVASAFDGRVEVDETAAFEAEFDAQVPVVTPTPRPQLGTIPPDAIGPQTPVEPAPEITRRQQDAFAGRGEFAPAPTVPEVPPPRPAVVESPVDDFSGTPVTQVDDFSGPSRNITQVDDFSGSAVPPQVDDFSEINTPVQVDDFSAYSNNNFGAQVDDFSEISTPAQVDDFADYQPPAQVDDFAEFSAPAQVDDFADYQPPAQVDDFAEINTPPQVDDFSAYSNNNFGAQVDDFSEINTPPQVDDFADYSDNAFGAQVDDFSELNTPPQVDDFADYSANDFGEEDFSDFATNNSPSDVNQFGVDDFGDPEAAQFDEFGDPLTAPAPVAEFDEFGDPINPQVVAEFDEFGDPIDPSANRVDNDGESLVGDDPDADIGDGAEGEGIDGVEQAALSNAQTQAINAQALKTKAQNQQTINEMREASGVKNADGDWRVKLRLAPQADYLYKAQNPGILAPLAVTDGIIFPYTPTIDVQYRAEYNNYQPTHSNYMHYFYKGSSVQTVQLQAEFTAQDTKEAEYLLACIHFLKSASKMFYGQDAQRGSPPPLLYLTGLGEYQFNEQPCAITEFNLNLPNDVNYIRARSRHINRDDQLQFEKPLATATSNGNFSALNRLKTAVTNALNGSPEPLQVGAKPFTPSPGNLGSKGATYVPTKMSMTINLLPIASRQQVSQQFSLKEYANGNLIKKGMW